MRITVNGKPRELRQVEISVENLLDLLEIGRPMTAVELNREIVLRDKYASTFLKEGDVVEILQIVGGG